MKAFFVGGLIALAVFGIAFFAGDAFSNPRYEFDGACRRLDKWFNRGGVDDGFIERNLAILPRMLPRIKSQDKPLDPKKREAMERLATEAQTCEEALSKAAKSPEVFEDFERSRTKMKDYLREYLLVFADPADSKP